MSASEFTTGIEYPHPFDDYAVELAQSASRYLCILSPALDHAAFDNAALASAIGALARDSRQTGIRILIQDARPLVNRGHRLLELSRRMPSKVELRKLPEHPDWRGETIVIRDRDGVLYRPAGSEERAFYEPDSRASTQRHADLFEDLWRHGTRDTELRALLI
ncbi:MAG: hypothetical protein HKN19_14615 [Halioglobus sp.]|nr:hypothetical protein [Halioglobus sp.]